MVEVPLYGKVEEVLASEIGRGDLKPGGRLPSEDELLARFGVSRITVRRAIQNLIQRGILEIRRPRHVRARAESFARTNETHWVRGRHGYPRAQSLGTRCE
jgi:DNA-binding FadR family transcriptional regulator